MAKFNVYKIKDGEESNLLERFEKAGLEKQKTQTIGGYDLTFYFSKDPDQVDIWWINFYKDFLSEKYHNLKNQIYYAVLHIKKGSAIYAISLSKSHFYIKDYCDQDFGLDLAERIANEKDVKIKNTKFFKNKRNKVITSYQNNSTIDFESGESMHFLKARSIDSEKWGKTVNFGQSVLFVLDSKYNRIPKLIDDIIEELKKPPRITLPKVTLITDKKKIAELDAKLIDAISKRSDNGSVEESQFTLEGVDFVFSDEYEYSFFLSGNFKDKSEKGILSIDRLKEFLNARSLNINNSFDELKVTVHKEHGRDHSESFKNYLEYVDEKDKICLIDGKWHEFNQSYLTYLKKEIDSIACDITIHNETLPIESDYLKQKEKEGFVVIHTDLESLDGKYSVEAGDMVNGDSLYVVKKGQPKQLNYAIDQAIASVGYLQEKNGYLAVDGKQYTIKKIILTLLIDKKKDLKHLFDLNSLIFHMKIIDWNRNTRNAYFEPIVIVEQYKG
jgi:uncharacterized protein (TIGR04141 family)